MFLKYIKNHPVGIEKGLCVHAENGHGKSLIAGGYVEEIKEKEYTEFVYASQKIESERAEKIAKEQKALLVSTKNKHEKAEKERIEQEEKERSLVEIRAIEKEFEKFKPLVSSMIKEALKK